MSGLFWPIFWMLIMLGLIISVTVVAMKEKKARKEAIQKMQPQPLDGGLEPGADPMAEEEGFGEPEMAEFGEATEEADFAAFDEGASDK